MERRLFSWVHLSDIHFGHGSAGHRWDQRLVLQQLKQDMVDQAPPKQLDAILVTGDVAFSGGRLSPDEYAHADAWLREAASIAGLGPEQVFLVPGNHDVNRGADMDRDVDRLVQSLRFAKPGEAPGATLDEALREAGDREMLARRMGGFLVFAAGFGPWAGTALPPAAQRLYWKRTIAGRGGLLVRLVGLNTALLSTNGDHGKLALGVEQLHAALVPPAADGEIIVVLTHHPLRAGWLADERNADNWLRNHADVHLSGHMHEADSEEARSGSGGSFVRVVAGASHGEAMPEAWIPASHGFGFGEVWSGDGGRLSLRVRPRLWSDPQKRFVHDVHRVPGGAEYTEHALRGQLSAAVTTHEDQDTPSLKVAQAGGSAVHPAERGSSPRDTAPPEILSYTELLGRRIGTIDFVPRTLRSDRHGPIRIGDKLDSPLGTDADDAVFVEGWSGRGKTTVLYMLARRAIQDGRTPILLRAERVANSLPRAVLEEVSPVPQTTNEADLIRWINDRSTLILIDDWHQASPGVRRRIEDYVNTQRPTGMAVVIAGAPGVPPKARLSRVTVDRYCPDERDAVIRAFFGNPALDPTWWLMEKVPHGLRDLLLEPVILEKYLGLIRRSSAGGLRLPANVPELMDSLLERMLVGRSEDPAAAAVDLTRVCVQLVQQPQRIIRHEALVKAIQDPGARGEVSRLEGDLVATGILRRLPGTSYEFEHDIWRRSFEAKVYADEGRWGTAQDVRGWVESSSREDLFTMLPFAAGLVREADSQHALFDALLDKDPALYFRALTMRADVRHDMRARDWAGWCVVQLYHGYVDLAQRHFPVLVPCIEPWRYDHGGDQKVVLYAEFGPPSLTYAFEIGSENDPPIIVRVAETGTPINEAMMATEIAGADAASPETSPLLGFSYSDGRRTLRGIDLARTLTRPGSTRLIGAKLLLENLEEAIKERRLATPWLVREGFGDAFSRADREGPFEVWQRQTVEQIVTFASVALERRSLEAHASDEQQILFSAEYETEALEELVNLGDWLKNNGFRETTLEGILLPGPSYGEGGAMTYTDEQRVSRIDGLCRAVAETYCSICNTLSEQVRSLCFFAQWPCRAIAEIELIEGDRDPGLSLRWDPCENWGEAPNVRIVHARSSMLWEECPQVEEEARQRCSQWRREFDWLRARSGHVGWWWSSSPVTDLVGDLLLSDVNAMKRLFEGSM